jgi:hypothetical protein
MPRRMNDGKPFTPSSFGNLPVPGTKAGAVVCIGLVVIAWIALPIARPFILGTGGLGLVVGLILWWKHSRE